MAKCLDCGVGYERLYDSVGQLCSMCYHRKLSTDHANDCVLMGKHIACLEAELANAAKLVAERSIEVGSLKAELAEVRELALMWAHNEDSLKSELKQREGVISGLRQELTAAQAEVKQLNNRIKDLEQELANWRG